MKVFARAVQRTLAYGPNLDELNLQEKIVMSLNNKK